MWEKKHEWGRKVVKTNIIIKVPFCLLNIQNPREIKRITTIIAEIEAISGTCELLFLQDFAIQRPELSSTLKGSQRCLDISYHIGGMWIFLNKIDDIRVNDRTMYYIFNIWINIAWVWGIYLSDSDLVFDLSSSPLGTNPVSSFFPTFLIA
jgi:hypothetical protein